MILVSAVIPFLRGLPGSIVSYKVLLSTFDPIMELKTNPKYFKENHMGKFLTIIWDGSSMPTSLISSALLCLSGAQDDRSIKPFTRAE